MGCMSMSDTTIIFGGPGTGKTSTLMDILDDELNAGINSERISLCSFTTKAAQEAITRACEKFNIDAKLFPWFRTIHSTAFRLINANRSQMLNHKNYRQIGILLGLKFAFKQVTAEDIYGDAHQSGDKFLFVDGLARNRMVGLKEQWRVFDGEIDWFGLKLFSDTLKEYKERTGLMDFTDLLERCIEQECKIDVDVAIIDEAQDLSKLQWEVVNQVFKGAQRTFIAGDDDQAIYRWGGADVEEFLDMKGKRIILEQSYRLPKEVFDFSRKIILKVKNRVTKNYQPRGGEGEVTEHFFLDEIDIKHGTGSWLMLARNVFFLTLFEEFVRTNGRIYIIKGNHSIDKNIAEAIHAWEALRRGEAVKGKYVRKIYSYLGHGIGVRTDESSMGIESNKEYKLNTLQTKYGLLTGEVWYKAFRELGFELIEYYRAVMRSGDKLLSEPEIIIDTIHSVKGGEADNVILLTDMTKKTYDAYLIDEADEHRVFYVGATRAKRNLHLIAPTTDKFYSIST